MNRILIILFLFCLSHEIQAQSASKLHTQAVAYKNEGRKRKAIQFYEDALQKAKKEQNVELQMDCHLSLAELKDNVIKYKEALDHYKSFSTLYRKQTKQEKEILADSVSNLEDTAKDREQELSSKEKSLDSLSREQLRAALDIRNLELDNEQHKLEIQQAENRKNILFMIIGMILLGVLFIGWGYFRKRRNNKKLQAKNDEIAKEKEKSEKLLLNILPEEVANELKISGRTTPFSFKEATIMFTDFQGFTLFSEKHTTTEIVGIVDKYFVEFDKITEKYGIEKIKTIGDAYMCVSGIPVENPDHVSNMIKAAREMRDFVKKVEEEQKSEGLSYLRMRLGIHTGPLVAGVVGSNKFAYDVWGDSVNIAARMEESGEVGQVNVSETVYEHVKDQFDFEYRGEVKAKNKGMMKMYFLKE
ncbi:MAG: adenylate/guanylate cyclase domain-containing protein [Brumimicrobium sp.]